MSVLGGRVIVSGFQIALLLVMDVVSAVVGVFAESGTVIDRSPDRRDVVSPKPGAIASPPVSSVFGIRNHPFGPLLKLRLAS